MNQAETITRKVAMRIGAIGGAFIAFGTFPWASHEMEPLLFLGILIRVIVCSFLGTLYAYLKSLPQDRWHAFERGLIAPTIFASIILTHAPPAESIAKMLNLSSLENVAYASTTKKNPSPTPTSSIILILKGIIGK